ncbi:MAG: DUF4013 domain-containing protein [Aestuariibacter sp.]|nr:DUF4013 domain-containing protein [Aestuariibacter sp.]
MDINKAFTYISEDENWITKLGWSILIGIVPILNFAIFGYQIEIARNVAAGKKRPLPDWDNLSSKIMDGFRFFAAIFVYMLPMFVVQAVIMIFVFAEMGAFTTTTYAPGSTPAAPPPELFILYGISMACLMPYNLIIQAMWPMFTIQIARRRSIASAFYLREIWGLLRAEPGNALLVMGINFGLYMATGFIMMIPMFILMLIPCVGMIVAVALYMAALFLVFAVSGHLQGQFIQLTNADTTDNYLKGSNSNFEV